MTGTNRRRFLGQVATGGAAALAAASGVDAGEVAMDAVHTLLRRHGAIVPEAPAQEG